ncbi:MAG: biotin transporter BioY [Clostridia bacterium]|nr:biotin transporter BioY [Clostridia bacterium]
MPLKSLTLAAMFAVVIAFLAQISIPLPFSPVPVTGQTLGVLLAGTILGKNTGTLAVLGYLLMGAVGLPVFARGGAGLAVFVGPTGGYLWGFVLGVYIMGMFLEKSKHEIGYLRLAAGMVLCLAVLYALGTLQLCYYLQLGFAEAFILAVVPYIPMEILKSSLAVVISYRARKVLKKAGYLRNGE